MGNNYGKTSAILFFVASACFFIAGIINYFEKGTISITYISFVAFFLLLGIVYGAKFLGKDKNDKKDK